MPRGKKKKGDKFSNKPTGGSRIDLFNYVGTFVATRH